MNLLSRKQATAPVTASPRQSPVSRRRRVLLALLRNPTAVIGACIVLTWVIVAVSVSFWIPYHPLAQNVMHRLAPPSAQHYFGTDFLGRDVFSRVMYASRTSLPLVVMVAGGSLILGGILGASAGYIGGLLDDVVMRVVDVTLAFPSIVLAMAVATAIGPGLQNAMIAMLLVGWPQYARLMRGQVLSMRVRDHVVAAQSIGGSERHILWRHIVPLCISPMIVAVTLDLGNVLLLASSLSFIGLGALPPTPEWGTMVAEGRTKFLQWWIAGFPGLAIMSLVMGFNFVGDAVRDALDPRYGN